ncbi:ribose 5-phosphate isomerase A domain protein [Bacteroides fragilis str. 3998T(B)3]|uniref:Ribose 5-phosphate isomerase A domain protein n=1 Tax=Bacteroides fragilis str. 3998T(B)3 TaxID=1339316 RepID=A0A015VTB4_BACFG|nr:ribose 5-phosphate isomerase A domain protein [Bacteroides fragilis str. 3998T(B)3]EXY94199.1 ribose 5-phosphate isomerase A domain protein [Bacteroides fragilis str. 3998 T(B) 4]
MKWESSLVEHLQWSDTITNRESKEQLARMIAMRVQEGEILGQVPDRPYIWHCSLLPKGYVRKICMSP